MPIPPAPRNAKQPTARMPVRPRLATAGDRAARQESLREHNLGLVLRQVLEAASPPSRAGVAAATGLTRATVSALVDRLLAAGMLAELPLPATRGVGRPAVPLAPARRTLAAVGLEVNVDYLGARALDLAGEVVAARTEPADFRGSDPITVLPRVAALAQDVVSALVADGLQVVGACLALPGLVEGARLHLAPNLRWRDVDLAGLLASPPFAALPVRAGNEAKLAAIAEARARRGTLDSFLYVSGEVGIGAALVHDREVFPGRHGWSGELGHTVVEPDGLPCTCGARGCLEQYAGTDALLRGAGLDPSSPPSALLEALRHGDPAASRAAGTAGRSLGIALANFVNLVDVPSVVLGGSFVTLAPYLVEHIVAELRRRVVASPWTELSVDVAATGPDAAMVGAALTVLRDVVANPAAWVGEA